MYTAFYGLREKPFSLSPDPRFLFVADSHREALAHLRYGLDQNEGFMAITGEVGTGKTTICRTLLDGLEEETEVAFLFNPPRTATELLQSIALEFGLEPAGDQRHALNNQLNRFLLEKKQQGHRVLLIIDEAQNLDATVLEEVRLLSNLETASSKLIQILMLGQPELDAKLDSEELRQLRQRISVRWHLAPLDPHETRAYVQHRLAVAAGAARDIFTAKALAEVHRRTGGVPRRINLLCDRALLAGYAGGNHRLNRRHIIAADEELMNASAGQGAAPPPLATRHKPRRGRGWTGLGMAAAFAGAVLLGYGGGQIDEIRSRVAGRAESVSVAVGVAVSQVDQPFEETLESVFREGDSARVSGPDDAFVVLETVKIVDIVGAERVEELVSSDRADDVSRLAADASELTSREVKVPMGTRTDRLLNTLGPGSYLGRLLDAIPADIARQFIVNAMLDRFGLEHYGIEPRTDDEVFQMLEQRGLSLLEIEGGDFASLLAINYPLLLWVESEGGAERLIALTGLEGEAGSVFGALETGAIEVPLSRIEGQWSGLAYVVWEPVEPIPELLLLGHRGRGVTWLQNALSELGYYEGESPGVFDRDTEASVIQLQNARAINPDGAVGPRTQMVLYELLDQYDVPRLERGDGAG